MELKDIYRPIRDELKRVEDILESSLKKTDNNSILRITDYLLKSPGKRIRPALVILSAKSALGGKSFSSNQRLVKLAAAIELIHMASLVHDDIIDHSRLRHKRLTINYKWGKDVSIALGDYLYSAAFELISDFANSDVIRCISSATKAMCEGELIQVCERDNIDLLKDRYIFIIKKKSASLFAASCEAGTLVFNTDKFLQNALRAYGLNFGIAFQIIDDYMDIMGRQKMIGKVAGQDIRMGEITLPLLILFESLGEKKREELKMLLNKRREDISLRRIKLMLVKYGARDKTKEEALFYTAKAKDKITQLIDSPYKEGLFRLADFIMERGFDGENQR